LSFFAARQKSNGSLGRVPWWNFVDWTKKWADGVAPARSDGSSAPLDLQLLLAYQWAAEMEAVLGSPALAAEDRHAAAHLRNAARELYWNAGRKLFAETPDKRAYSQQANALAVLAGVTDGAEAKDLIERVSIDEGALV
jgi:alpha-L-rhamnosidase